MNEKPEPTTQPVKSMDQLIRSAPESLPKSPVSPTQAEVEEDMLIEAWRRVHDTPATEIDDD